MKKAMDFVGGEERLHSGRQEVGWLLLLAMEIAGGPNEAMELAGGVTRLHSGGNEVGWLLLFAMYLAGGLNEAMDRAGGEERLHSGGNEVGWLFLLAMELVSERAESDDVDMPMAASWPSSYRWAGLRDVDVVWD